MTKSHAKTRPITLLIAAMGGEGGGVLAGWISTAAVNAGYPVQRTSIPGVAQRTGATTYYLEIFPVTREKLGGKEPILSLYPAQGCMDLMVATELLEAGRSIHNGFATKKRTTLVGSSHRVYSMDERTAMGDERLDEEKITTAIRALSKKSVLFDMAALAKEADSHINAVVFGALAATEILPVETELFRRTIEAQGKSVAANLRGFDAGFEKAKGLLGGEVISDEVPASIHASNSSGLKQLPEEVRDMAFFGFNRLLEYQDLDYANLYIDRLVEISRQDVKGYELTREVARRLAVVMAYEDIIRVAQLKLVGRRLDRVKEELDLVQNQPYHLTEYLKPSLEEISAVLPQAAGIWLNRLAKNLKIDHLFTFSLKVRTTTITGVVLLKTLFFLKRFRRSSLRFGEENSWVEDWLAWMEKAAREDVGLAMEVALTADLIRGYGATLERGSTRFATIAKQVVAPALAGDIPTQVAIDGLIQARHAALTDPSGEALARMLEAFLKNLGLAKVS